MVLEIVFSPAFKGSLDEFIESLEGSTRPLELVQSDFLKFSVENELRHFFRVVRSVTATTMAEGVSVKNPMECAEFLSELFRQLSTSLADYQSMVVEDAHFRKKLAREGASERPAKLRKLEDLSTAVSESTRPCSAYLGGALGVKNSKGKAYKCDFGKDCCFLHPSLTGLSQSEIRALVRRLPGPMQGDFKTFSMPKA